MPRPGTPADAKQDENVIETFPASDPVGTTATRGARAVPPAEMANQDPAPVPDGVTLGRDFPDLESAKLALEALVRDGPVDRRAAELVHEPRPGLRLRVPAEDAPRIEALLHRA